ncbi:hypothetical protein GOBAR_DD22375 [Gossypium barbadense]|nr:hypothetical protein GOBAR_DD22375 [Gossypium barbadense]
MMIDSSPEKPISWKDMLVGQSSKENLIDLEGKEDLEILEGDIQKSFVNGVPSISFSDRIQKILIQGMDNTMILKLLGRNIDFSVLQNKLYNLWKPSAPIHMMDIENGYFLVKFQNKLDCEKALSEGSWIIFGQYLTVQPWSLAFDPTQAYPNVVMAWIRFPGLPGYLYNHKIITEIGGTVGKVVKLDMNTDNRTRGRFARLAVYINLEKPLVSHILINGRKQNVEYESLSTICFHCGRFGHVENSCPFKISESLTEKENAPSDLSSEFQNTNKVDEEKENGNFGPWMIVEKKSRRKIREKVNNSLNNPQSGKEGTRFRVLNDEDSVKKDDEGFMMDSRRDKGKEISQDISMGKVPNAFFNGKFEWRKSNNNKSKDVGLKDSGGPTSKVNGRPILEPNNSFSILKENSPNIVKAFSSLGHGDLTAGQARGDLGSPAPELVAQHLLTADGSSSRSFAASEMQKIPGDSVGVRSEGESSENRTVLMDSSRDSIAVSLDVGNLDSNRHSAVVFHNSSQSKENIIIQPPKNFDSSLVLSSGSGKGIKNRARGQAKKQAKILHGSNTRFKISGSQRTSLKESMEHLAESISSFAPPNLGVVNRGGSGVQIEGDNAPGQ